MNDSKKLSLSEISVGMEVDIRQLDEINDTYILIADTVPHEDDPDGHYYMTGRIVFIGKEQDDAYFKAYTENTKNNKAPMVIIQHNTDMAGGVLYEQLY